MAIKNRKAFTLIEVLAILIVLASIATAVLPQIGKMFDKRKEIEYQNISTSIENAAKQYVSENYRMDADEIPEYIPLYDLVDNGYIKYPVVDPRTGEDFSKNLIVRIEKDEDNVLVYTFSDDSFLPSVNSLTMTSDNNINNSYARNGSIVTVDIVFKQTIINTPTVTINGRTATVTGSGNTRVATYTIPTDESTMAEGQMAVVVSNYTDEFNTTGDPFSQVSAGSIVIYDRTPPTFSSFYIGGSGNPSSIMSTNTILSSSVTGANHICISTSTSCSTWQPYASSIAYTLTSGDGTKTLYATYRDFAGNTTTAHSDSIILDTTPPTYTYFYIGGSGNPPYLTSTNTTLYISAVDATNMCISTGTSCSAWESYSTSKAYTVSTGDGNKTLYIKFRDAVGNITSTYNDSIFLDTTSPICTSSGGSSTWRNTNLTITGTCSDTGGSGCSASTVTKTYSVNTNSTTESPGTISDNAGHTVTCPSNQTVKIDKTAPTCTSSGGSSTWRNTNLTLTGTCSDTGGSGCSSSTITKIYSVNTNSTAESPGTVRDNAGNTATCSSNQTVKIDKTIPSCASSGGSSTWRNTDLTLTGTCSDTGGSGCSTATITKTYSVNTNSTTASAGTVTDIAGNSGTCSANQTVKIDKTAPTCTPSGGSSTWRNTDLTLTGTCSDTGGSGCSSSTVTKVYSTDINSTTQSPGTVTDIAGNSATCSANQTVKIDKIAPSITGITGGSSSWTSSGRTLVVSISESGSGVAEIRYRPSTDTADVTSVATTTTSYSKTFTTGSGYYIDRYIQFRVIDAAGNASAWTDSLAGARVRVDKTDPTISTSTYSGTTCGYTASCSDTGSGVASCSNSSYSTNVYNMSPSFYVTVTGKDNVGNSRTKRCTFTLNNPTNCSVSCVYY